MIELKTVDDQINDQDADKAVEMAMDCMKAISDEITRLRRMQDGSKSRAKAITYVFESGEVFYTYGA